MNLKQVLLSVLNTEQAKELCAELDLEADRRSRDAMAEALSGARRAKSETIVLKLTVGQLRDVLSELEQPTHGIKDELIQRVLLVDGRSSSQSVGGGAGAGQHRHQLDGTPVAPPTMPGPSDIAAEYRHRDLAVQRPDAGVQDQFEARKPPKAYRYDSSLDPALSWDEQRERDLGEWLLGLIVRVSKGEVGVFSEPQEWKGGGVRVSNLAEAAQMLQQIGKSFLNWAGKAEWQKVRVPTVPLFVHERHSTRAVLDGIRQRKARGQTLDLFGDAGMDIRENLEAYEHKGPWQNRMVLGDSLAVMNSMLEFEGLGGQVQMIYIDPPYGVKFGSNFQPFVRKRDVKHGGDDDMTREPEMVKAYRDTWELGLHSYLTYLRDRLSVARQLLAETGSVFVQISEDNIHHVREVADEVFSSENFVSQIYFATTSGFATGSLSRVGDYLLWYGKDKKKLTYKPLFVDKDNKERGDDAYKYLELSDGERRPMTIDERRGTEAIPEGARIYRLGDLQSSGAAREDAPFKFDGEVFRPNANNHWKASYPEGMGRLADARRVERVGRGIGYVRYLDDNPLLPVTNSWMDTGIAGFTSDKLYVVQTNPKVVQRCVLMTTNPGDLVLDPTCGSGTTAFVAEQWGRRWITIDTSRVPLALARQRLLTATFPYYKLKTPQAGPAGGFVYERKQNRKGDEVGGLIPRITLKSIANSEPPEMEVLVDRPEEASGVTRVSGPFVVEATIAPVQPLETAGENATADADVSTHIQRMIEVLRQSKTLRLPGNRELTLAGVRRTVDKEYLHAEAMEGEKRIAIIFGPADGAVSSTLVFEAGREALYHKSEKYERLYFFGFAVEPGARALIEDEKKMRIPSAYVAVTPDVAMSDLLKTTRASEIFSVTGLPDVAVRRAKKRKDGQQLYEVELKGLDLFDPESMETESVAGESVPCWMLDTDYDGLCFYASQVLFPKTSAWDNLQRSMKAKFDDSVWSHLAGAVSEPFALGDRRRIAVKVIDERGNELMRVHDVAE